MTPKVLRFDDGAKPEIHYLLVADQKNEALARHLTGLGRQLLAGQIRTKGPYTSWVPSLQQFLDEHQIPSSAAPGPGSWTFLMPNLVAAHPEYEFSRDDLTEFRRAFSDWYRGHPDVTPRPRALGDGDAIQGLNKTGQWGLKHQKRDLSGTTFYRLRPPFTYLAAARYLLDAQPLDPSDRAAQVQRVKDYMIANWIDVPDDQWEQGHANPADPSKLVWQPGQYQRARRDRYIFDEMGLPTARTVEGMKQAITSGLYSVDDQRKLLELLKAKLQED